MVNRVKCSGEIEENKSSNFTMIDNSDYAILNGENCFDRVEVLMSGQLKVV